MFFNCYYEINKIKIMERRWFLCLYNDVKNSNYQNNWIVVYLINIFLSRHLHKSIKFKNECEDMDKSDIFLFFCYLIYRK